MKKICVTIEGNKVVTLGNAKEIGEIYTIPLDLEALTIEQAQQLYNYINTNATEDYRAFMAGLDAPEQKVWSSQLKEYSAVVCGAIAEITGIPAEAFSHLSLRQQRVYCDVFELQVIRPLYMVGLYEPQGIKSFEWGGVEYHLPKMTADGFGGVLPMSEETAESWAESNDLHLASENPYEYMPLIVAILCRPEGEAYNELTARARAEQFRQLPAYIAFEVFFCKLTQSSILLGLIGESLEQIQKQSDQTKEGV
ncbi:MAG: hypothetical protein IIX42_04565 [Alistipes sp.]|nr:hypothetical protein [Alistipes sp.]